MNITANTNDYEPIWKRQLRETAEKLLALRDENRRKREADLTAKAWADTVPPDVKDGNDV